MAISTVALANDRRIYPVSLSVVDHASFSAQAEEFSRAYAAGEEDEAVRIAIAALETDPAFAPSFESLWWLCGELLARRKYRLGLELTERVWKRGYRGWRALYLRGMFLALNREIEPAAEILDSARKIAPADKQGEIALLEARLRAMTGQTSTALELFRENLKFNEANARFIAAALRIAHSSGDGDLVIRWGRRANKRLGETAARMRLLADVYCEREEWQKARNAAEAGVLIAPKDTTLGRIAARCAYRQGNVVRAINRLEAQLAKDKDWTEGKVLLCRCLLVAGRDDEALRTLKTIEAGSDYEAERRELAARLQGAGADVDLDMVPANDEDEPKPRRKKPGSGQDSEVKKIMSSIPVDFLPRWNEETLAARGNPFAAIMRMAHSVRTIMLRETMAKFGRHELGYLWAVLEPMMHVLVLSFIFYFIRLRDTLGMNVVLFVSTGVVPLFFYLKTYGGLTNALRQNRPLLNHSLVQPMDIFFARSVLEFFTQLFVFILFVSFIFVFVEKYTFGSAMSVFANMFGLWITGIGAGLIIGSLASLADSIKNVMDGLNRLVYITSGVFFTLDRMPPQVAEYAAYNPLLHFVDGVRGNFSPLMGGSRVDIVYGYSWAVAILVLGLIADRALRRRVLDQ
ncbi:ABC transporter permease [Parvibaculum sp.]|uniref:ABC transporter permease n=1 Tax=Parvibaculum sp. TaxID=2024848 RepID=UPI001E184032|nr:ABC transporter permease [Parvibaculum sp.]MBX3490794.1 ABC transporter permease [Parvibaculum sp.]MCW5728698.1 ABC transporter permease [Parvibaculum sp.]